MDASGEIIDRPTRRANRLLFVGLFVFALALTALCVVWMHYHAERIFKDQVQEPPTTTR